ncbi:hypothetical protein [Halalkalibacter krulwichiae]|uniref:Uncharacterized protein n=1 Tax=Halalkalibacter krulwichiae TaxID=199441 RepID=A0A1X9MGX6_9BACI|nr:hypothetical protein [Halalkalibacter krulwichiae]ARK31373.1 hypothetical protein BkAM31D_16775 [Halalkalibacter krulwichiae]
MKRFHQLFIIAQILFIASIAFTSLAPAQAEGADEIQKEATSCDHDKRISKDLRIHLDFYYELLANKYDSADVEKWKEIRSERDLLQKRLKEAKQKGELQNGQVVEKTWLDRHAKLQSAFTTAVEKRDEEQIGALLPQIFDHYEKLNGIYKKRLNLTNAL